jgi:hypothetical protein
MKNALQNVSVFLVATLISLVGIEICLRIWGPEVLTLGNPYVLYQFDPVLGWNNRPNAHGRRRARRQAGADDNVGEPLRPQLDSGEIKQKHTKCGGDDECR